MAARNHVIENAYQTVIFVLTPHPPFLSFSPHLCMALSQ